ncbi:MAG TPA: sigma-70 family RNA polymerase sigma factor [Gemmataceae bacterium]|jgi:RNA polymerase sigma factor (sigma-70 family)
MPPNVSQPTSELQADPIRTALQDPTTEPELRNQALAYFSQRLPGRPIHSLQEEANDAVQETVRRALSRNAFNPELGSVGGWLHGIMAKVCLEQVRKLAKRPKQPASDPAAWENLAARTSPDRDPTELPEYLGWLSPENRQLVEWHLEELTHLEIGQKLGISPGASRVRLSRAVMELKRIVNDKEGAR